MKQSSRKILAAVLMVVLIGSIGLRLWQQHSDRFAAEAYNRAEELLQAVPPSEIENTEPPKADLPELWVPAPVEDDPYLEELRRTDLSALKEVNPDVVGWISIPGTVINFPLLQGSDNHYYLKYTWDNQRSNVGAIYLDSTIDPLMGDFNSIIYGHNLLDGTMFSSLLQYADQEHYNAHPYIYVVTENDAFRYEIYSAYEAEITSYTYRIGFNDEEDKREFIGIGTEKTVIETGVSPLPTDRILTLSTCMNSGTETRWVVQAGLKMIDQNAADTLPAAS